MKTTIIAVAALAAVQIAAACDTGYRRPSVAERQYNQRERIRDGVDEGDLTRRVASRLRERSRDIGEERRDAREDGVVTRRERRHLQRRQNNLSDDIREQRHDAQER